MSNLPHEDDFPLGCVVTMLVFVIIAMVTESFWGTFWQMLAWAFVFGVLKIR